MGFGAWRFWRFGVWGLGFRVWGSVGHSSVSVAFVRPIEGAAFGVRILGQRVFGLSDFWACGFWVSGLGAFYRTQEHIKRALERTVSTDSLSITPLKGLGFRALGFRVELCG